MERIPAENQKRRKKSQSDDIHTADDDDTMDDEDHALFHVVVEDLRLKSTVGWQNAVKSLSTALAHIEREAAQRFLDFAFGKVVSIMLDQHSSKIGQFEKSCVVQTLTVAVPIVVTQLKSGRVAQALPVLVMLFNKKRTFYKDLRTSAMMGNYWNKVSGAPEVRAQCISAFCDLKGFELLLETLEGIVHAVQDEAKADHDEALDMIDSDDIRILLQALFEARGNVADQVVSQTCILMMTYFISVPESFFKRESTDAVGSVIATIRRFVDAKIVDAEAVNGLWLDLTQRFVDSVSLPLRLFGLEQLNQIVNCARASRAFPPRYLVQHAGTQSVNGVYVLKPDANNATYVLRRDETGQVFTLFCCTMKSGLKWWFISEADKMQPGSDQDIDYYQHQSQYEEYLPPTTNWMPIGRGEAPAPELIPETVHQDFDEDPSRFDNVLSAWVAKRRIIETIFGDRIHREVVSRSSTLVRFLAESKTLTAKSIDFIWGSCIQKDHTLVDEIHTLLISTIPLLADHLILHLVETVHASFQKKAEAGELFPELTAFLQRLTASTPGFLMERSFDVTNSILRLLWSIQLKGGLESDKSLSKELRDFFRDGLRSAFGETLRRVFLNECVDGIKRSCFITQMSEEMVGTLGVDHVALKSLELLKFLIDSYGVDTPSIIESLNVEHNVVSLLFDELAAFVGRCEEKCSSNYVAAIGHRLDLIHHIHLISPKLVLSIDQVHRLWQTLSTTSEGREQCLLFFNHSGGRVDRDLNGSHISPAFSKDVRQFIFTELLCKQTDYNSIGVMGYRCFHTYFVGMNISEELEDSSRASVRKMLGLDALWCIAFEAPLQVAQLAADELLRVYGRSQQSSHLSQLTECVEDFLNRVFTQLSHIVETKCSSMRLVEQCAHLLNGIVDRVSDLAQKPQDDVARMPQFRSVSQHGRRGRGSIFEVKVIAQRIPGSASTNAGGSVNPENSIRTMRTCVYANQTLAQLRTQIELEVGHPIQQTKILCAGAALSGDEKTVAELRISEVSELRVLLFNSVVQKPPPPCGESFEMENDKLLPHPGHLIASNWEYCSVLFRVLDAIGGDHPAHSQLWSLLKKIPTSDQLYREVSSFGQCDNDGDELMGTSDGQRNGGRLWASLLRNVPHHQAVYTLQIIDALLLPSDPSQQAMAQKYQEQFISQAGFEEVLSYFLSTDLDTSQFNEGAAVALRLLRLCLFGVSDFDPSFVTKSPGRIEVCDEDYKRLSSKIAELVLAEYSGKDVAFTRKLDSPARIIIDALKMIRSIVLLASVGAERFIGHNGIVAMTMDVFLRCDHDQVREQLLLSLQPVCQSSMSAAAIVFDQAVLSIDHVEDVAVPTDQYFRMLRFLVQEDGVADKCQQLSVRVLSKLREGFSIKFVVSSERYTDVVVGFLEFLRDVLLHQSELRRQLAHEVVEVVYDDCLFTLPSSERRKCPLCMSSETRRPAFKLLATAISSCAETLHDLQKRLSRLFTRDESAQSKWGQENHVEPRGSGDHVGLKNQGCSCYINSFLQQIFMHPTLRDGLLAADVPPRLSPPEPMKSEVADDPERLVGFRVALECVGGRVYEANVVGFDKDTARHRFQFDDGGEASFILTEGRPGNENGRFAILPSELTGAEASLEVLRQVQRTFCYLRDSEMRYFNPKALVDACKCLNLEFSVYQQNDASEFCDKLLDRLETGLKSTPQGPKCLTHTLGGKLLSQKLPVDCGHRYEREEPFIRLELQIRGKESIEDSLASFVEGELMDGDNKVECELCSTKKAAIRRTCFGTLPNFLILHLKRFDLDYTTFETVKLNNRCSFPMELNMKPYTKVGLEEKESGTQMSPGRINGVDLDATMEDALIDDDDDVIPSSDDTTDDVLPDKVSNELTKSATDRDAAFEYRLKGILVHSGVAQGGHYYSFIFDHVSERWFKYDDEDVTPFDPANIESECFGGMQRRAWQGSSNSMEIEMFSNALMLFYEKVVPSDTAYTDALMESSAKAQCVYETEVWKANEVFLQNSYLLDVEFHEFLREMVQSKYLKESNGHENGSVSTETAKPSQLPPPPVPMRSDEAIQSALASIGSDFVLSVLLHSREKHGVARWITVLASKFAKDKRICAQFFDALSSTRSNTWLQQILFESPDSIARQSLVHLVSRALSAYETHMRHHTDNNDVIVLKRFLNAIVESLDRLPASQHTHLEECFMLLRNCADLCSTLREDMLHKEVIGRLVHLFLGDRSPSVLKEAFSHAGVNVGRYPSPDYQYLLEAIKAILGMPRRTTEPVVNESNTQYPHRVTLSEKAEQALTEVFDRLQVAEGGAIGVDGLSKYFSTCSGCSLATPVVEQKARGVLSKYGIRSDTQSPSHLELDGFLLYYTDLASSAPRNVYQDLRAHGYGDDLKKQDMSTKKITDGCIDDLRPLSRAALLNEAFFDAALEEDAETAGEMLFQIAHKNRSASLVLLRSTLNCLNSTDTGWKGQPVVDTCSQLIQRLLASASDYQMELIEMALANNDYGLLKMAENRVKSGQRYGSSNHVPLFVYRQIVTMLDIQAKVEQVKVWLDAHRTEWEWMYEWLRMESLKPSLGGRLAVLHRENAKLETLCRLGEALSIPFREEERSYIVEGAGFEPVNGLYRSTKQTHDNCPIYSCVKDDIDYTLFRCCMPSKARRWYISYSPNKSLLGTVSDEDYYFVACHIDDESPPKTGWKVWTKNEKSLPPAPVVRLFSSTVTTDGELAMMNMNARDVDCGEGDGDADADTVEYDDSEDEIRVSNERFQAVHLDNQDDQDLVLNPGPGGGTGDDPDEFM